MRRALPACMCVVLLAGCYMPLTESVRGAGLYCEEQVEYDASGQPYVVVRERRSPGGRAVQAFLPVTVVLDGVLNVVAVCPELAEIILRVAASCD